MYFDNTISLSVIRGWLNQDSDITTHAYCYLYRTQIINFFTMIHVYTKPYTHTHTVPS